MSRRDLTQQPILSALFFQASPMVLGIAAVFSISLVDTYFVGKLGTKELAALSFTFPVTMAIASLSSGLGAGAASLVSRMLGKGESNYAKHLSTNSLILSVAIVTLLSTAGFFSIDWLFGALGAKGATLQLIKSYMQIWYISMPFLVIPIVANAIIRSAGNAKWPGTIMVLSALINIALTPMFIFGFGPIPAMHIEGAAVSTLLARVFTFVLALYVIHWREALLNLHLPSFKQFYDACLNVMKIAIPAGAGSVVNPIAIGVVTAILATYDESVVAAFGIATRIESFASIPLLALSAAIGPVVGQNWGADNKTRVYKSLLYCYGFCVGWAILVAALLAFVAPVVAGWFTSDADVKAASVSYLYIVIASLAGYGCVIVSAAAFNALGRSGTGLGQYLVRSAVLYVPLSWLVSLFFDYTWVFAAIAASNLLAGVMVAGYTMMWMKTAKREDCVPTAFTFSCENG